MPERRVLVVDDDDGVRRVIGDLLEDEGYAVRRAASGQEALDLLAEWLPDLILLDLMMPIMDGWQFRAEQRQLNGPAGRVPILVLSAVRNLPTRAEALEPAALLPKPFDIDEVLATIEYVIEARLAC
jgi:two-component system, chemotaxis family, chemotaxis protein CheY